MPHATSFLTHVLNSSSLQTHIQTRLMLGDALETVVIATAHELGYAVTVADITAVLDNNPALADKIMALLPAPMLELDDAQLMMMIGGSGFDVQGPGSDTGKDLN